MGKAAILVITASIIMGSMYSLAAREDARQAQSRLSTHQYEVLARNAALAGYNRAKQAITDDFASAPAELAGSYAGSDYDVTITKNGGVAEITARGTSTTPDGKEVDFTVTSNVEEEWFVEMAEKAPPFMRYAVLSEGDLSLNGSILTDLYVDADANTLNANMHTNGSLIISGNALTVRGFGTYVDAAIATPSSALQTSFDPYNNPTGDDVTQQVINPVDVPSFDVSEFLSKVSVDDMSTGPVTLSGTYDLGGSREDPYVWHIQGDLVASGDATINGYTMFIVEGNVELTGNVDATQSAYDGSDESNMALYASGTVNMSGNARVKGQIYAGTGVSFLSGTPRVYGSIATSGLVTLAGTPKIYYRVASPALTTIFEDLQPRYNLVTYSEW